MIFVAMAFLAQSGMCTLSARPFRASKNEALGFAYMLIQELAHVARTITDTSTTLPYARNSHVSQQLVTTI